NRASLGWNGSRTLFFLSSPSPLLLLPLIPLSFASSSSHPPLLWVADSQRSHLTSFTMKLMDKFHSPKIKRTPSKKGKQQAAEPAVKSAEKPVNKKVSRLEEQEKEVVSALRYFKTIVDKMAVDSKVLQMLPGSASKVLEAILPLVQVEARSLHSSAIASCHNRVYQSLANLIRWSDQVMLEGIDLDDKDTVTTVTAVIKAVLDGVKELVKLTIEKQEQPCPASPSKPAPPVAKAERCSVVCEMPLTDREKEILSKTTPIATPTDSLTDISEEEVAPPKPPLPGPKLAEHRSRMQLCSDHVSGQRRDTVIGTPPALPPKKRQSAPSPTRVAVVAPMSRTNCGLHLLPGSLKQQDYEVDLHQRRFSGGSQSYGGDSPHLSPCSSMGKLSKSDEQLSSLEHDSGQCSRNTSCETLGTDACTRIHSGQCSRNTSCETLGTDACTRIHSGQCSRNTSCETLGTDACTRIHSGQCSRNTSCETLGTDACTRIHSGQCSRNTSCETLGTDACTRIHSGQCSRNTSCETLGTDACTRIHSGQCSRNTSYNTDRYDPDYDFLHQDLSVSEPLPFPSLPSGCLSPLPECLSESPSPSPTHPRFSAPVANQVSGDHWATPSAPGAANEERPPALPQKKRRSAPILSPFPLYERLPSHYDNLSGEDAAAQPFPLVTPASPGPQCNGGEVLSRSVGSDSPPPLPEKKSRTSKRVFLQYMQFVEDYSEPQPCVRVLLQYMQFVEDYSEPQPCVFYQTPQSERIYEQRRNKRFQEVYGHNEPLSTCEPQHEATPPPALPPKQRQLASHSSSPSSSSSSSLSLLPPSAGIPEEAESALGLSLSVSNAFLSGHASLTTPTVSDDQSGCSRGIFQCQPEAGLGSGGVWFWKCLVLEVCVVLGVCGSGGVCFWKCLVLESESANDETGEGEYVNLYSASQANGDTTHHSDTPTHCDDVLVDPAPHIPTSNSKEALPKERVKLTDMQEDIDELSLVDHKEIMNRITLKAEGDDGPDVRAGSSDILLVHATETDRKDLVLYCEAFLTTYRTFMTPEDLIKKLHYRYPLLCRSGPDTFKKRVSKNTFFVLVRVVDELCLVELTEDILRKLMDLVFQLVCSGELSLARVLRKNILDKVEQKRLLRHTHILKPLAARGVSARPGTLHDFRSHEIADQLTLLDAGLFYKIEIPEVLLWAKEQNEEKSPNLTQFTEHFNNMSYWVRSIIIQQEKAQDREKLLLKFIKIMKHLRKLNNFNSYLAILSALDSAPIRRLEWQKQTSEGLEEYCTLIDSSSSFRAYRAALAEVEPPCIPYLGLILQDLTFVHLGNPDLIDRKVNFSKRWQQFNILDSMRRFQQVHYELRRNDDIVSFFNDFSDHLAEEALWELSLKIKPRNITRRRTEREEKS
ncbi:hypothetical protein P4O66_021105, partial [Electrophorus voltai]